MSAEPPIRYPLPIAKISHRLPCNLPAAFFDFHVSYAPYIGHPSDKGMLSLQLQLIPEDRGLSCFLYIGTFLYFCRIEDRVPVVSLYFFLETPGAMRCAFR